MSDDIPSLADLQKQRVVDLKKELARLGLSQSGVKAELVARLHEHYQEQGGEESAPASEEPTPEATPDQSAEPSREPTPEQEPPADPTPDQSADPSPEPEEEPAPLEQEAEEEPESAEQSVEATPEPESQEQSAETTPEPQEPEQRPEGDDDAMDQDEPAEEEDSGKAKVSLQFAPPVQHPAGAPPVSTEEEFAPVEQEAVEPEEQPAAQEEESAQDQDEYGSGEYGSEEVEAPVESAPVVVAEPDPVPQAAPLIQEEEGYEQDEEEEESRPGKEKKERRKKPKKKKKKNRPEMWAMQAIQDQRRKMEEDRAKSEQKVDVEYIQEELALEPSDPLYRTFNKIFQAFKIQDEPKEEEIKEEEEKKPDPELTKVPKLLEDDDMEDEKENEDGQPKISKRKLKQLSRLSVAELKQLVSRPDVVEMHDVTARDPRLLVHLKSTRNTVPVPRHWCFKRKYLQGKRGIEKPPFDLPEFIKKTGIMEMREALQEKEEAKGMKSKMREKVRPKLGKIDIDYQKLHDAFFKWQTKPKMSMHGDLYYEGKEFEIRLKEKKPGDLTDDLRTALGMPVGPNAHKVPPPWLIAMQRYGPPPSYPNLKCPGLNAPIPEGTSFGYHAGGWGKPPVDEAGKPLYGDVFGTSDSRNFPAAPTEDIDQTLWGEMESESEEESDSDSDEEEEGEEEDSGLQTPVVGEGLATPSGVTSVGGAGLETPDMIELRKRRIEADMEGGETPSLPYTVIPERANQRIGGSMMGSAHTYDIKGGAKQKAGAETPIEMALNPEEIDLMDSDAMALKAEAVLREQEASLAKEDLSDMVAEHAAKQRNKRKRQEAKDEKEKSKKYKEFKF